MDWIAIKGIIAAQVVLATDCTQDQALEIVDRHMARHRGRVSMTAGDVCSMILMCTREAAAA